MTMTDFRVFVPVAPLSVNRVLRMHWRRRQQYNTHVLSAVLVAKNRIGMFGRPMFDEVNLSLHVKSRRGQIAMDPDNLVASCKPFIDALVVHGIIRDDSPDVVRALTVDQEAVAKLVDIGVEIVVSPLNGGD